MNRRSVLSLRRRASFALIVCFHSPKSSERDHDLDGLTISIPCVSLVPCCNRPLTRTRLVIISKYLSHPLCSILLASRNPSLVERLSGRPQDILGKLSFGKAGNTLAQDLYLAALADQTGLERRAALAAGRGETVPSTSPAAGVDPAGSPLDADKDTSTKAPSSFAPLLARDLPSRSPTGDLEHPLERRARQAAELTARREAAERTLASEGSVFERVGAWVELGRLGWAEGTWEGGRGWGAGTSASKENA